MIGEGCHESRRCSRDTYPESYITKYTRIRRANTKLAKRANCLTSEGRNGEGTEQVAKAAALKVNIRTATLGNARASCVGNGMHELGTIKTIKARFWP